MNYSKRGNSSLYVIILVFFLLSIVVFTFISSNNNFISSIDREKNIEYEVELENVINDIESKSIDYIKKNCEISKAYIDEVVRNNKIIDTDSINYMYYQDLKNRIEKSDKTTNFKRNDVYGIEVRGNNLNSRNFQSEVLFSELTRDDINEKIYKLTIIIKKEDREKGLSYREVYLKTYYPSYSELSGNKTQEVAEVYYGY